MNSKIKISIIIPVYNAGNYIKKCIDSILSQTYENFEVIVINDGSSDNSWELLNKYYSDNKKIKLFNQENKGVSMTRNFGIDNANGDWITFVDADDWIENNTLERIVNIIEQNNNLEIIMSNLFYNRGSEQKKAYELSDLLVDENNKKELIDTMIAIDYGQKKYGLKFGNCRCIGGKFYKSKLIKENNIKFPTDIVSYEDGIFNLYSNHLAKETYILSDALYHYYFNVNSRTNTINEKQFTQNELIIKNINKFLKESNIESDSINYCCLDLFTMIINNIVLKNKIKNRKKGIKQLKDEYKKIDKYLINGKIENQYLIRKNKILYYLLIHKKFKTIYFMYLIKNKIKNN